MLGLQIEHDETDESTRDKEIREATQTAQVIADFQARFPGAWGRKARFATREDVTQSGIVGRRTLDPT
jgi:hypothetical protein